MSNIAKILPLLFLMVLTGCSSNVEIETQSKRPKYFFDNLHVYGWHENTTTSLDFGPEKQFQSFIKSSISNELASKGYTEDNQGDFIVNFSITKQVKVLVDEYNTYSGFDPNLRVYKGGEVSRAVDRKYNEKATDKDFISYGTLVIDIIDPKSNKLVWRSVANKKLDQQLSPLEAERILKESINKSLSSFPSKR